MQCAVRDLRPGDVVQGKGAVANTRVLNGENGTRAAMFAGDERLKTACAIEVDFADGTQSVAHPGSLVTISRPVGITR